MSSSTLRDALQALRKNRELARLPKAAQIFQLVEQQLRNDPSLDEQTRTSFIKSWTRAPELRAHLEDEAYVKQAVETNRRNYAEMEAMFELHDKGKLLKMHDKLAP
jgi:hypothetical protein